MSERHDLTTMGLPLDLETWIAEHAEDLQPPVSNAQVWQDSQMTVMVVGGGNERTDFHDDPCPEFFHQLRGAMTLQVIDAPGEPPRELEIAAGQIFLLPPHVPHSPQRPDPDSVGLVVEYARPAGQPDGFEWYCANCHERVHRTEVMLESIVDDLPPLFEAFYADLEARTCPHCGTVHPGRDVADA